MTRKTPRDARASESDPAAAPAGAARGGPAPDARARARERRGPIRRVRRRAKQVSLAIGVVVVPRLYLAYMWLVSVTSRTEHVGRLPSTLREHYGKAVFALWHEEVFFVAHAFQRWRPSTLASHGPAGEIISRMLALCDFDVFRGGSSRVRRRRATHALHAMIDHMKSKEGVIFGITTDGSYGTAYRMKSGVVRIAVACQAPMAVEKTWCRRYFRLPTWDGTIVPLPFNHIVHVYAGPFLPPPADCEQEALEAYRKEVETALCRVSCHARRLIEGSVPEAWVRRFPEHCREELLAKRNDAFDLRRPLDALASAGSRETC